MTTHAEPILAGVACNLDQHLLQASLPLFAGEKIDAIEWSFDTLFNKPEIPDWFIELLNTFGAANRLVGHGVYYSLFSGKWRPEQQAWLDHLRKTATRFRFDHISEHFGFMTGEDFHKGAPISVPFSNSVLSIGTDRLKRLQDACQCPVGLENLAFSYSPDEVRRHGEFLDRLVEPVNGFIILDLHNFYCQQHNFNLDAEVLMKAYPLDRVREIHLSGGSWEPSATEPSRSVRRDTHDDRVPEPVFELLRQAIPLCPNLRFVMLEQLGIALKTPESQALFRQDFEIMKTIVAEANAGKRALCHNNFLPAQPLQIPFEIPEDPLLHRQQSELSFILENATGYENACQLLLQSSLAGTDWKIETWSPYMLETALRIAQKWKKGW